MAERSRDGRTKLEEVERGGLSPAGADELRRWLLEVARGASAEVGGVDRSDVAVSVGGDLLAATRIEAAFARRFVVDPSGPASVRPASPGRLVGSSQERRPAAAGLAPIDGLQTVLDCDLLVRGAVAGTLSLYVTDDRPRPRLSDQDTKRLVEGAELILSSPILVAQADANAQWLRRARESVGRPG